MLLPSFLPSFKDPDGIICRFVPHVDLAAIELGSVVAHQERHLLRARYGYAQPLPVSGKAEGGYPGLENGQEMDNDQVSLAALEAVDRADLEAGR